MQIDPITDANGNPVSGATVVARSGSNVYTATTNSSGVADFDSVPDGTYDVYAYKQNGQLLTSQMKRYTQSGGGSPTPPQSAPSVTPTVVSVSRIDLSWTSVSGATSYQYRIDGGSAVSVGSSTSTQVTGLTPNTQYSFEVRATNSGGSGPWSAVVQATTQAASSAVINESFNKADGSGLGPDHTWTIEAGSWETVDGKAKPDAADVHCVAVPSTTLSSADQWVEADVTNHDGNIGLDLRARHDSDAVRFLVQRRGGGSEPAYRIVITGNDVIDVFDTDPSLPYTARLEVWEDGGTTHARGLIDGVEVISTSAASGDTTGRNVALRKYSVGDLEIDNFRAGDL